MQGDRDKAAFLQKSLGYALTGDTRHECFFVLYGPTSRNGKGTTLETFMRMVGDYGKTVKPDTIAQKQAPNGSGPSEDIVDVTIIDAPSSTKNAEKERDPEMHQTKKGNQYYFGEKLHIGVDAGTGYIHSLDVTAANVADITMAAGLLREDDQVLYGDAAYTGLPKRDEVKENAHLASIDYRTNSQKPYRKNKWLPGPGTWWHAQMEYAKSRVRCKVEYPFLVIKRIFGYRKVRYRGLAKNRTHAYTLCACANLYMLGRSGWCRAT